LRFHQIAQPDQFLDQRFVDLQSTGGIENQGVAVVRPREIQRFTGNLKHVRLAAMQVHGKLELLAQFLELVHRRGAVHVGCH
jgi:hypothetical protein